MSELGCVVCVNPPGQVRIGTVGRPLPGVETRLAADGELLVRSASVMRGYRNDPEQPAEAVDPDGFLRTGDLATIDADGYVSIVDRKKDLIINAAGKNMSPANIEKALESAGPLISRACTIGDARPYNIALLTLDPTAARTVTDAGASLTAAVHAEVVLANATLARVEQIKHFHIVHSEWAPGVELTPTLKLRRRVIAQRYAETIDALYTQPTRSSHDHRSTP
jgi:long-subunit acyl-CoA synthetase (AMP-forming)